MAKKEWTRKHSTDCPVVILTAENIADYTGASWMGSRTIEKTLKDGLEQEGKCWLIRKPFFSFRVGKRVIEEELGLEIFEIHRKDDYYYLVDEAKAREAIKDLR